ncbi:MAG: hypothetical protein DM484_24910 [Candidatus Methylumidiphilus alinenensis]|uniref:Uncharacterized protein n=1 Tax=Candidatus Methylumidiphilus alinenensis TaxID=2202197 RepID=A0A2W4S984_9GAMM|nr:MAG: hypothetical protein DM484_24910 [Candidatus Methylumidiphilus alinenensis]
MHHPMTVLVQLEYFPIVLSESIQQKNMLQGLRQPLKNNLMIRLILMLLTVRKAGMFCMHFFKKLLLLKLEVIFAAKKIKNLRHFAA